jgi:hypothetical protein
LCQSLHHTLNFTKAYEPKTFLLTEIRHAAHSDFVEQGSSSSPNSTLGPTTNKLKTDLQVHLLPLHLKPLALICFIQPEVFSPVQSYSAYHGHATEPGRQSDRNRKHPGVVAPLHLPCQQHVGLPRPQLSIHNFLFHFLTSTIRPGHTVTLPRINLHNYLNRTSPLPFPRIGLAAQRSGDTTRTDEFLTTALSTPIPGNAKVQPLFTVLPTVALLLQATHTHDVSLDQLLLKYTLPFNSLTTNTSCPIPTTNPQVTELDLILYLPQQHVRLRVPVTASSTVADLKTTIYIKYLYPSHLQALYRGHTLLSNSTLLSELDLHEGSPISMRLATGLLGGSSRHPPLQPSASTSPAPGLRYLQATPQPHC